LPSYVFQKKVPTPLILEIQMKTSLFGMFEWFYCLSEAGFLHKVFARFIVSTANEPLLAILEPTDLEIHEF
jgi:hypothetical protein